MSPLTILIADDEPIVRNLIVNVLVRDRHSVLEADSAEEALEIAYSFKSAIDLLIADHALKTMTGREVAEKICRLRPGLKVLHISGFSMQIIQQDGGIIPGAAFLAKPFKSTELIKIIRELYYRAP
jgi:two-component system cell cycle sensor histidine kinase/response regulator CckA